MLKIRRYFTFQQMLSVILFFSSTQLNNTSDEGWFYFPVFFFQTLLSILKKLSIFKLYDEMIIYTYVYKYI